MSKIIKKYVKRSVSFTTETIEQLDKLAKKENIATSELIRRYVDKGLGITSYETQIDFIRTQIREELKPLLKPQFDRIVKLLMRIGMMTVSFCYFNSKIILYFVPTKDKVGVDELMAEAKHNAAAYLNMRDATLDNAFKEFDENN